MGIGRRQQQKNKSNRAKKELLGSAPTMAPQEVADGGCVGFGHTSWMKGLEGLDTHPQPNWRGPEWARNMYERILKGDGMKTLVSKCIQLENDNMPIRKWAAYLGWDFWQSSY